MPPFVLTPPRRGIATAGLLACLAAAPVWATDYLLGPVDQFALDQPRITFGLSNESAPGGPELIGPEFQNLALLDTGANGILLGQLSYANSEDYQQAMFNGQPATYDEQGVAGFSTLEVYEPHGLRVQDSAGNEFLAATDLIAFGDPNINLGSFAAIVGMPAMAGRVVEVDMRPNLNLEFQTVLLHDRISQASFESAASLNVDLRMIAPEYTDPDLPARMQPTFAALPVIDQISMTHTGGSLSGGATLSTSNTFLLDTGAQTMIISEAMATSMGLNFGTPLAQGGDQVGTQEVGGIGGTVDMNLVVIDELRLPTTDGVELVFTNILSGVLDIEGAPFDAVLGMNLLNSGYTDAVFGGGGGTQLTNPLIDKDTFDGFVDSGLFFDNINDVINGGFITITLEELEELADVGLIGDDFDDLSQVYCDLVMLEEALGGSGAEGTYFDKVIFDFTATDGTGVMRLDLSSLHEAGDTNLDGFVGAADLEVILANWGDSVRAGNVLEGDLTGDGLVNQADLDLIYANFGNGTPPGTVPEPASALLLMIGLGSVGRRRRHA